MKKIIWLAIIVVLIFFLAMGWWNRQLSFVSSDKSAKVFVIAKGAGVSEIAKKLKSEGLIKSELVFKIYVKQNNLTNKLQAGSHKLSPSMSPARFVSLCSTKRNRRGELNPTPSFIKRIPLKRSLRAVKA